MGVFIIVDSSFTFFNVIDRITKVRSILTFMSKNIKKYSITYSA